MDKKIVIFATLFLFLTVGIFAQKPDNKGVTTNKKSYVLLQTDYGNMKILL